VRHLRRGLTVFGLTISAYFCVLAFPEPVFANHITYQNYDVWSDRPIDPAITSVLDDATERMKRSDLYDPGQKFRIFFCNEAWRLGLYDVFFDTRLGGATDTLLTRNIYLRESDIAANRIVPPPDRRPMLDARERPLAYFVAHEATHVMESRAFGRLMVARFPLWLNEGYADYIGKGGDFDFDENRRLLAEGDEGLDPGRSGLYRRYHLEVALLLDKRKKTIAEAYANPPREVELLRVLGSDAPIDLD
jgi:hypothetical protein